MEIALALTIGGSIVLILRSMLGDDIQTRANSAFFESLDLHRKSISALMDIVKAQQVQIDNLKA